MYVKRSIAFVCFFMVCGGSVLAGGNENKNKTKDDDEVFLPETQLVYSYIYSYNLDESYDFSKYEILKESNRQFENLYEKYITEVLKRIPVYSGFDWEENLIEIYPVTGGGTFSHPLTIAHFEDQEFMFFLLVHELVHHNMGGVFPTKKVQEATADRIAHFVLRDISPIIAQKWERSSYYRWQEIYDFDLTEFTVSDWLERNMQEMFKAQKIFFEAKMMRAHKGYEKAIKMYREVADNYFWNEYGMEAQYLIAEIYHQDLKDYKKALEEYLYFTEVFTKSEFTAESLYRIGEIYQYHIKDSDTALKVYQQLISYRENWNTYVDDATVRIADVYYENGDYLTAIDEYWAMIKKYPKGFAKGEAYQGLGRAYAKLKLWHRSRFVYEKAIKELEGKENIHYPEVLYEIGMVFEELGNKEAARQYYFKLLANHEESDLYDKTLARVKVLL